MRARAIDRGIK